MFKVGDKVKVVRDIYSEQGVDNTGNPYISNFVGYEGTIGNVFPEFENPYEVVEAGEEVGFCFSENELELI